jgi:hypothetical protein
MNEHQVCVYVLISQLSSQLVFAATNALLGDKQPKIARTHACTNVHVCRVYACMQVDKMLPDKFHVRT